MSPSIAKMGLGSVPAWPPRSRPWLFVQDGTGCMTVDQLIGKIYNKLSKADIAGTQGKVAVQFNLTGKVTGVFYIEILNGVLSVMPYEYIDRDACVSGTLTNLEKVISGKMVPQVAIAEGKIKVEGNVDKVMLLAELMKQA